MKTILYVVLAAVIAFVLWRLGSVGRGARRRNQRILRELVEVEAALRSGTDIPRSSLAALAAKPHLRRILFAMLKAHGKAALFPEEHVNRRSQAEAALVYWMMHPNELQDPPKVLEHVVTLSRDVEDKTADFEIFRYRMPAGHWAGSDWILGLAGPFFPDESPYEGQATGWSLASETEDAATPESVLDGYIARVGVLSRGA